MRVTALQRGRAHFVANYRRLVLLTTMSTQRAPIVLDP
jgi:hypothetical protein